MSQVNKEYDPLKPQRTIEYVSDFVDLCDEFDVVIKNLKDIQERHMGRFDKMFLDVEVQYDCVEVSITGARMETVQEAKTRSEKYAVSKAKTDTRERQQYLYLKEKFGDS
jgi:hypothetical protein